tara:strand:+ start:64 stop:2427 length:2364 start_codon:yes stop_codon:yes gene_type:complete
MKGTFFSADFIKDENDNLRLLEINTDTACITYSLESRFDFSDWITIMQNNNITKIVLIYKGFQDNVVEKIQSVMASDATFITDIELIKEEKNTIYPTAVADADDKFILRLAYDENALFDSTYAKGRTNILTLFADNDDLESVPEFFYEGSEKIYNTFTSSLHSGSSVPDAIRKNINDNPIDPLDFIKFDMGNHESQSEQLLNQFYSSAIDTSQNYVEKYHLNTEDIVDSKISSYRQYGIVYGNNIDYVKLGSYSIQGMFTLPEVDFNNDYTFNNNYYYVPRKHYFELTTNYLRVDKIDGLHNTEKIIIPNESPKLVSEIQVSGSVESFFISGSPDTDEKEIFTSWSFSGNELPSGSYITSSVIETISSESGDYNSAVEVNTTNGDSYYVSPGKHFLVYQSGSNSWTFKKSMNLTGSSDYFMNQSGSLVQFSSSNYVILENSATFYRVDVETTDNFFISSSNSILVHNAPCFVAGTKVHIENKGITNIEDVKVGDKVISYNHENDEVEYKEVKKVKIKTDEFVVTYLFENGTKLTGTPDHPLYVVDKGYASYSPKATKEDSGLDVEQILLGDEVLHMDGYGVTISDIIEQEKKEVVYNLDEVDGNNNFFVEDLLAHNRAGFYYYSGGGTCFSANVDVTLSDGTFKKINEIEVGDMVQGWDGETIEVAGKVIAIDHRHTVDSHGDACKSLGDVPSLYTINDTGIEFTPEHPFLTKEGWKSLVPDPTQEPYKTEQEPKVLQVGDEINRNGNWISIESISVVRSDSEEKVYNITVEGIHSYLANGIVVHNK